MDFEVKYRPLVDATEQLIMDYYRMGLNGAEIARLVDRPHRWVNYHIRRLKRWGVID